MEAQATNRIHPLVAGAAVAVIVAAGVGVAAITGHLPGSNADTTPSQPVTSAKPAQPQKHQVAAAKPATEHKPVAICKECGTIVEVKEVDVPGKGTGIGAVAGGVGGAVVGHQIGENRAGTAVGAVVGAVAGHQIERQARMHKRYDIVVKMNDGTTKNFSDESGTPVTLKSGDKVRIAQDGSLKPQ